MNPELIQMFGKLLLFALLCATVLSYLLTPLVMKLGFRFGLVDEPNERRIHTKVTPRCGGLAVFLGFSLTLAIMCFGIGFPHLQGELKEWISLAVGVSVPLIVLGLIDDRWEVSPLIKLLGQLVVAALAWSAGIQIEKMLSVELHPVIDASLTIFLYVAAMNAYNLIDGMDGVAAGLAAITSTGLCGLNLVLGNEPLAAVCLALTGACLGFLRFNFHPARVFLGDTGSLYLGFMLMTLTLGSQSRSTAAILFIVPLLTMGVPMIDTGLAIWRRSVRKAMDPSQNNKVSEADKDHLHHRLARRGLTQRRVAMVLYAIQASVFAIGLFWVFFHNYRMAIFTVAFFVGSYVVLRYLASLEMSDSGRWIVDGIRRPGRLQLYRSFMPLLDILILSLSLVLLSGLVAPDFPGLSLNRIIREMAAPIIGGPIILIWATKYYRLQWTRARPLDYFNFGAIVVAAIVIGVAISPIPLQYAVRYSVIFTLVLLSTTIPCMLFLRIFPRLAQDMLHHHERKQSSESEESLPRVLIYGAGYGFTLITRAESFDDTLSRINYCLVGLIDDDASLKGRTVHGHTVLGTIWELESLALEHDLDEILVSTLLDQEHEERLLEVANLLNLKVSQSMFANRVLRERTELRLTGEDPTSPDSIALA